MKQICQRGFNCPFMTWDIDDRICTYPHMYFWKNHDVRVVLLEDGYGFDVETLKDYEWSDTYGFVSDIDCPLVDPGSELDPVMQYTDEDSP